MFFFANTANYSGWRPKHVVLMMQKFYFGAKGQIMVSHLVCFKTLHVIWSYINKMN